MSLFSKSKSVKTTELPKDFQDIGNIKDLRDIHPPDIKKLEDLHKGRLDRDKAKFNFRIQKIGIYLIISIVGLFYLCLFLSFFDVIKNDSLKELFAESIYLLITSVVGFALGYFYRADHS